MLMRKCTSILPVIICKLMQREAGARTKPAAQGPAACAAPAQRRRRRARGLCPRGPLDTFREFRARRLYCCSAPPDLPGLLKLRPNTRNGTPPRPRRSAGPNLPRGAHSGGCYSDKQRRRDACGWTAAGAWAGARPAGSGGGGRQSAHPAPLPPLGKHNHHHSGQVLRPSGNNTVGNRLQLLQPCAACLHNPRQQEGSGRRCPDPGCHALPRATPSLLRAVAEEAGMQHNWNARSRCQRAAENAVRVQLTTHQPLHSLARCSFNFAWLSSFKALSWALGRGALCAQRYTAAQFMLLYAAPLTPVAASDGAAPAGAAPAAAVTAAPAASTKAAPEPAGPSPASSQPAASAGSAGAAPAVQQDVEQHKRAAAQQQQQAESEQAARRGGRFAEDAGGGVAMARNWTAKVAFIALLVWLLLHPLPGPLRAFAYGEAGAGAGSKGGGRPERGRLGPPKGSVRHCCCCGAASCLRRCLLTRAAPAGLAMRVFVRKMCLRSCCLPSLARMFRRQQRRPGPLRPALPHHGRPGCAADRRDRPAGVSPL